MSTAIVCLHRELLCKLLAFGDTLLSNISSVNKGLESDTQMQKVGTASAQAIHLQHGLLQHSVVDIAEYKQEMLNKLLVDLSRLWVIGFTQTTNYALMVTLIFAWLAIVC